MKKLIISVLFIACFSFSSMAQVHSQPEQVDGCVKKAQSAVNQAKKEGHHSSQYLDAVFENALQDCTNGAVLPTVNTNTKKEGDS